MFEMREELKHSPSACGAGEIELSATSELDPELDVLRTCTGPREWLRRGRSPGVVQCLSTHRECHCLHVLDGIDSYGKPKLWLLGIIREEGRGDARGAIEKAYECRSSRRGARL